MDKTFLPYHPRSPLQWGPAPFHLGWRLLELLYWALGALQPPFLTIICAIFPNNVRVQTKAILIDYLPFDCIGAHCSSMFEQRFRASHESMKISSTYLNLLHTAYLNILTIIARIHPQFNQLVLNPIILPRCQCGFLRSTKLPPCPSPAALLIMRIPQI